MSFRYPYRLRIFLSGGNCITLNMESKAAVNEFLASMTYDDGQPLNCLLEVANRTWINPSQVSSIELEAD